MADTKQVIAVLVWFERKWAIDVYAARSVGEALAIAAEHRRHGSPAYAQVDGAPCADIADAWELCMRRLARELAKKEERAESCALSLKNEEGSEDPAWANYVPPVLRATHETRV